MATLSRLWRIIVFPRRIVLELAKDRGPRSGLIVTLGLGVFLTVMMDVAPRGGQVYDGLANYFTEKFAAWKTGTIGLASMAWPIVLISYLVR